jgi:hypothetical protein
MRSVSTQSVRSHSAVTSGECLLCGGPCLMPMVLAPVPSGYPFMHPDDIALTQPQHGPEVPAMSRRARRLAEDRAHHPRENR